MLSFQLLQLGQLSLYRSHRCVVPSTLECVFGKRRRYPALLLAVADGGARAAEDERQHET